MINRIPTNKHALQDIFILIIYEKLLIRLLIKLLMKLLIKPEWRGVFQMYPVDFKQKEPFLNNDLKKQPFSYVRPPYKYSNFLFLLNKSKRRFPPLPRPATAKRNTFYVNSPTPPPYPG